MLTVIKKQHIYRPCLCVTWQFSFCGPLLHEVRVSRQITRDHLFLPSLWRHGHVQVMNHFGAC